VYVDLSFFSLVSASEVFKGTISDQRRFREPGLPILGLAPFDPILVVQTVRESIMHVNGMLLVCSLQSGFYRATQSARYLL